MKQNYFIGILGVIVFLAMIITFASSMKSGFKGKTGILGILLFIVLNSVMVILLWLIAE